MNVVLITLDTFNYECFIDNIGSLPYLSQLKEKGVFFENAFSVGPHTSFAFPGIVGSIYPYHFGTNIDKNVKTIYSMLKERGYNTAFINESNAFLTPFFGYGKGLDYQEHFLSLSHDSTDRNLHDTLVCTDDSEDLTGRKQKPFSLRFQEMVDRLKRIHAKLPAQQIHQPLAVYAHGLFQFLRLRLAVGSESLNERRKLFDAFQNKIREFANNNFVEPQFLWIHTIVNHLPYLPPDNTEQFDEKEINYLNYRGLSCFVNRRISERLKSLYVESLRQTDQLLGDIIDTLKDNDLLHETLIIVTADHGEEFGDDYVGHRLDSSSDALLHVPLIFYWPSQFDGKCISIPVSTLDILPTVANIANVRIPNTAKGVSLKEFLSNQPVDSSKSDWFWHRPLYSEAWETGGMLETTPGEESRKRTLTVREGRYKLKAIEEVRGESTITTELDLIDWIDDKQMDIQANKYLVRRLRYVLYKHLYKEGIFHRTMILEKARIKRKLRTIQKI